MSLWISYSTYIARLNMPAAYLDARAKISHQFCMTSSIETSCTFHQTRSDVMRVMELGEKSYGHDVTS